MDIKEYSEWVEKLAYYPEVGDNLDYPMVALGGEAGELLNELKKVMRGDPTHIDDNGDISDAAHQNMVDELGDVFFYAVRVAAELGVSPEGVMDRNIEKLAIKHPDLIPEYWKE